MSNPRHEGWQPDESRMGNWREMFEPKGNAHRGEEDGAAFADRRPREEIPPDEDAAIDGSEYRPWILQRGRTRPAMMLELRRFEPKSGMWHGWMMSYPSLVAVEFTGTTLVSLDFGNRQFLIEGLELAGMIDHLQSGTVMKLVEYSKAIWPVRDGGPVISSVRELSN